MENQTYRKQHINQFLWVYFTVVKSGFRCSLGQRGAEEEAQECDLGQNRLFSKS